jgi:hypothetical protein
MNGRERVIRTLTFRNPDRAPRDLWAGPGVTELRADEYQALCDGLEWDFAGPPAAYPPSRRARGSCSAQGEYVDEWGVLWVNAEPGVTGEVKQPILTDDAAIEAYRLPWELLDKADFSGVNAFYATTDRFVRAGTITRPFERLQFLRGTETALLDLTYGTASVMRLLDRLHEFYVREMELWSHAAVDGIMFMDDWGSQTSLLISPDMWRGIFKPMYAEYCRILHRTGKSIFFHSDGHIEAIFPDLIEIGIDAVNSQLFCMNIEELAARYKGKITFWGEIDRQHLLPFGTPEQVKEGVRRVRRALDDGRGGVIAQCEWGKRDPAANIAAVFEAWDE